MKLGYIIAGILGVTGDLAYALPPAARCELRPDLAGLDLGADLMTICEKTPTPSCCPDLRQGNVGKPCLTLELFSFIGKCATAIAVDSTPEEALRAPAMLDCSDLPLDPLTCVILGIRYDLRSARALPSVAAALRARAVRSWRNLPAVSDPRFGYLALLLIWQELGELEALAGSGGVDFVADAFGALRPIRNALLGHPRFARHAQDLALAEEISVVASCVRNGEYADAARHFGLATLMLAASTWAGARPDPRWLVLLRSIEGKHPRTLFLLADGYFE